VPSSRIRLILVVGPRHVLRALAEVGSEDLAGGVGEAGPSTTLTVPSLVKAVVARLAVLCTL